MTFALIVALGATATATTYNWTGTTSTAWATTTNWSPNGNPGSAAGDVVQIGVVSFTGSQPTLSVAPANALASITLGTATNATLTISAAIAFTITGAVTINAGSTWTESAATTPTFQGGITNSGTFTASTGVHTFNTNAQALSGTISIPSVTVTAITLTNNGTLTVGTALAGTGGLTNSGTGTLNLSGAGAGSCAITTLANAGIINRSAAGTTTTAVASFTNTGTINITGSGTIAGITNNAGGIVNHSGSSTITSFNNATSTSTLNISTTPVVPTITTLTVTAAGNTVNYNGAGPQTVIVVAYNNLTLSGSGAKTFAVTTVNNNLTLSGTATAATTTNLAVTGNLVVGSGTTLTIGANFTLGVTGTSSITGTLTLAGTGAQTFTGDVTINSGGIWNETGVSTYTIAGNFTNNATTFTANTGIHTFSGATKILSGATITSIPTATFTGAYTNSGTLTCAALLTVTGVTLTNNGTINATTALAGTGTLLNGAAGTLALGGTCSIATLTNNGIVNSSGAGTTTTAVASFTNTGTINITGSGTIAGITNNAGGIVNHSGSSTITSFNNATSTSTLNISTTPVVPTITTLTVTAAGNTVNYNGAGPQTVIVVAYNNLTLSGSSAKTMTGVTVTNILDMAGTSTVTVAPTYGSAATLQYDQTVTAGPEWITPFVATGGVIINSGTVTLGVAKVIGNNTSVPLKIVSGATLTPGTYLLTFNGDFINAGILTSGTGGITIAGTVATQSISGFITTGNVSMTKTSGTAIISGAVSAVNLTVNGTGGTLVLSGSNAFSGTRTLTAGTLVLSNTAALGAAGTALALIGGTLDLANDASVNAYNITVGGSATITSDKATAASAGITHTLGTLSIGAYTLTIAGGSNVTSGTAGVTFGAITHTSAPTYTINNPAGGGVTQLSLGAVTNSTFLTTFNGSGNVVQTGIFGNGSGGVTYSGTGTLTLNQANTFTGGTTLNSGTLKINNASALGTVAGTFTIAGGTIDNSSGGTITTINYPLTLSSDFSFIGSNNLNLGSGTVTMNASHQITINANTLTIGGTFSAGSYNLTIAGAGALSFGANVVTLNGLTISSGTLVSTSSTMSLSGNFSNSGTFTANGGTVNLNGTATQTIGGSATTSFNGLTVNNSTGIVLGVNTIVAGTLTFTNGTITTNAYSLAVSSTGTVSRTSGYVIGNLNLYFATGATSHTFDIGDASAYTPVTVSFASVTTAGSLTASTTTGDHPQILTSGLNSSKTANRYWTLTNIGIVFTTYNVVFTFVPADLDPSAVPASFSVARYNSGTWSTPTIGTRTSTTTQATGIAAFGDFQVGNIQNSGVSNYTVTRHTGISYNSIAATGNAVQSWRTTNISDNSYYDDNRSYPVPIGFDFWYDGSRYTQFSVSTNGYIDFDASNWNGGSGAVQQYSPYGPYATDFVDPTRSAPSGGVGTVTALAPFYFDLTTWQTTVPLGNSIKYQVDGTAPNRVLTIEWINMSCWVHTEDILYFQVKLHETSGVIEYNYGTMSGTIELEAGFGYVTGINGPSISPNPPTAAQLLCLQTANTNTFSNTQQYQLLTMPQTNSNYTFTPNIPTTPSSLNFSNVTCSSMRLSWNDLADNELGYAIYRSDNGGATYTFIRQLTAGSTHSDESGLIANTTYYWKVYAFTEGGLSSALSGSYATLPAVSYLSVHTGIWSNGANWDKGVPPNTSADVTIADGTAITLDVDASINSLTVGQGSSGTLLIGVDANARALTIAGDLTVKNGATLTVNTGFTQTGHTITLSGNLINNGILNLGPNASSAAGITLNKPSGTQTISGTGTTTKFNMMNVNVGSTSSDILEVTSSNFSSLSAGFLTLTNGTFKVSTGATITPLSGSQTISSSAGLWINNSLAVVSTTGGDLSVAGILHVTAGTLNIGNAADNRLLYSGGTITIDGGTVNVAGRIERANLTTIINFNMSGGVLTVPTVGSTSTTVSPIEMTVGGSAFTWSNGSIIIQQEGGSGAQDFGYVNTLTNFTVTGGTLQIGNPSTPAAQRMNVNSSSYIYNILVNNTNATAVVGNITILNNMTVTSGALETTLNGLVSFNGTTPQNITAINPITFNNLTLNNSTGLTISSPITVTCTLTLTNGTLSIGANTLTFQTSDNPIARTSGTITTTTSSNLVFGTSGNTGGAAFTIPAGTFTTPPSINNFTINRTNNLTLNDQMMSLNGILLCNGPLTTNGNLTLLSTAAQTALIDGSGSGQISGNVIMQRYLPSGFGYKYVSSPFQTSTVNEFSNDLDLGASFPTFYNYNENIVSSGWVSYTTTTNLLIPMQGYAANFGSAATAKTADISGVVNNGSLSITLYNHNQPYTLGFNLVGNPYPSPINWDAASGWTKTNIDNALYYFQAGTTDQYTGTYSTYINGISSDGLATNIIPSMQGFFIHVSNGSYPVTGTLGITNSVRINDLTHALLKSMRTDTLPLLRITAGFADNGTQSDPAVIYFDSSATQSFDKNLDALKLMNTDVLVPNLYTMTSDSSRLSIIAIPFPADSIRRIPLGIKTAKDGWITFKANNIVQIPAKRYIYLVDTIAGISQDLRLNPQYRFFLKAGEYKNRFSLVFSLTVFNNIPTEFSLLQNFPNPFNPRTTMRYLIPHTSFVSITVYDILGREVSKLVNEEKLPGTYEVQFDGSRLSSGVYFYRLHADNFFETKKLVLLK
jgi:fibronectin-binding autotransporter adhesin